MKKKIFTIITARTGSARLSKKCIRLIKKKPIIEIIIQRSKEIGYPVVLATTKNKEDNILCEYAKKNKIYYFRGSEKNVLKRWNDCIEFYKIDIINIVDADDLLLDYNSYKKGIKIILKNNYDYINSEKNSITGLFNYVCKASIIKRLFREYKKKNIETIEPFLKKKKYKFFSLKLKKSNNIRLTLDYNEDLVLFKKIFSKFSFNVKSNNVISYLQKNKKISNINYFRQSDYKSNQKKKYEKLQGMEV